MLRVARNVPKRLFHQTVRAADHTLHDCKQRGHFSLSAFSVRVTEAMADDADAEEVCKHHLCFVFLFLENSRLSSIIACTLLMS
jgi:hypothetical protein